MKHLLKFNTTRERNEYVANNPIYRPFVHYVANEYAVIYTDTPTEATPFYIESNDSSLTVTFNNTYEYSRDGKTWESATSSTSIAYTRIGERVYFRASGLIPGMYTGIGTFKVNNGTCNLGGNLMSMVYGADFVGQKDITKEKMFYYLFSGQKNIVNARQLILPSTVTTQYCYGYMFYNCTSLVAAPELPATTLNGWGCYAYMFQGCTSLVTAPKLPATKLSDNCYSFMFSGCTSLVAAPELPAITLKSSCYGSMLKNCTSLKYIKAMFTTTPSSSYTGDWVSGVAATGTFVKNAEATWDVTGVNGVPEGWTVETATE